MRTTEDPKENTIRVRVNDEMREYLKTRANANRETVSEYVRQVLLRDMHDKLNRH